MRLPALLVLSLSSLPVLLLAQNPPPTGAVMATVRSEAGASLAEAEVRAGNRLATTDAQGLARLSLPAGPQRLTITRIGFQPGTIQVQVPPNQEVRVTVTLEPVPYRIDSVTVLSTRIGTNVESSPLKVDVVAHEDISEKSQSSPGSAVNIFREPNALLQVQTTAPSLGGVAVRIQGLRGRYTQVLADGLPIYGTDAGELSLVQIPPLDLGRVEIIRGAASALYGGQALGGVINLFSRAPVRRREILAAQAYRDASDLIGFAAGPLPGTRAHSGWAYSLLAGGHRQQRRDLDQDGWTNLPGYRRLALRPRLFWSDSTGSTLLVTAGTTLENREAGTVGNGTPAGLRFPEALDTRHFDFGVNGQRALSPGWTPQSPRGGGSPVPASPDRHRHRARSGAHRVRRISIGEDGPEPDPAKLELGTRCRARRRGTSRLRRAPLRPDHGDAGRVRAVRPALHLLAPHLHQPPAGLPEAGRHHPEPACLRAGAGDP